MTTDLDRALAQAQKIKDSLNVNVNSLTDPAFRGTWGGEVNSDVTLHTPTDNAVTVMGVDHGTHNWQLYQECHNDIVTYVKSHKYANSTEVFRYIEGIMPLKQETVEAKLPDGSHFSVKDKSSKYNAVFKEIEDYRSLMKHIHKVISEVWQADNLEYFERQKQAVIYRETKNYLLRKLTEMLILSDDKFLSVGNKEVQYFISCVKTRNFEPALNVDTEAIYEGLKSYPNFNDRSASAWYFLANYQNKPLETLKEEYIVFNGPKYLTLIEDLKVKIVPEQPEKVTLTVNYNLDCEAVAPDANGKCPNGFVYDSTVKACLKVLPNQKNTKVLTGTPVLSDSKVYRVEA